MNDDLYSFSKTNFVRKQKSVEVVAIQDINGIVFEVVSMTNSIMLNLLFTSFRCILCTLQKNGFYNEPVEHFRSKALVISSTLVSF